MASVQDQDVLRNMILTFRVTDLQMLLGINITLILFNNYEPWWGIVKAHV